MTRSRLSAEEWVSGLSLQTTQNLGDILSSLIPVAEVRSSNPLDTASVPITDFDFSNTGISKREVAELLDALVWKGIGHEHMSIENDRVQLTLGAVSRLKDIQRQVERRSTDKNREIEVHVVGGILHINQDTGLVRLNEVKTELNLSSREFRVLLHLATNKNYQATYPELVEGDYVKQKKRLLSFVIRNIKQALGILPEKRPKNKDIIGNIRGYGYKLLVSHTQSQ